MRVLVTGANGQLGSEVTRCLQQAGYTAIAPPRSEMDFLQPDSIRRVMSAQRPDAVINCAAWTQVDLAESEPDAAFAVNRDAAGVLAACVQDAGVRLLHVSTDFVFDGRQTRPYREDDEPAPLGLYGKSKLEGEHAVQQACPDAVVLRTAWVYGVRGHNFVKTILRHALAGKPLRVVGDQVGTPSWAADIADALVRLLAVDARGIYHYTDAGETSWYGFAAAILEQAAVAGFEVRTTTVEPISTADWPTPAARPAYSVLDTAKITALLSLQIPHWRDSLANMLKELAACADCL